MKKLVLFHRDFRAFTGGHLKVWDYFNHVASSPNCEPRIAFSRESKLDATNPWSGSVACFAEWTPGKADVLFLAGTDWRALPESDRRNFAKPIVNLIQHPRHAETKSELRGYLSNHAVRICVSAPVAEAIQATGEVNGPVFTIPNGIDLGSLPALKSTGARKIDLMIGGLKAPQLGREVHRAIAQNSQNIECLFDRLPRHEYLSRLSEAKIALVLPRPIEGFYLPALEAMASGAITVCPDCVGNRDFCLDEVNCFRPDYDVDRIVAATRRALQQSEGERALMQQQAQSTVARHLLATERTSFLRILAQIDDLWRQ
jgi:hypothetical protein